MTKIKDVAEIAGVSSATVSRVLNGNLKVSPISRDRVLAAAKELGYRPNRIARNLRRKSTESIGVIVSDIENPHFAQAVGTIESVAYARGYRVLLCNTDESLEKQRAYLEVLVAEQVQGVILAPADPADPMISRVLDGGIPIVAFDRVVDDPRADAISADNITATRLATEHLLQLGHRDIGFVGGRERIQTGADRLEGYRQATTEAGIQARPVNGEFRLLEAENATADLLARWPETSAIVVANNLMTIGTMRSIAKANRRIPDDIALVAIDDPFWAELTAPALTALAQPVKAMATAALDLLFERITHAREQATRIIFEFELHVRGSSGPVHTRSTTAEAPDVTGKEYAHL